MKKILRSFWSVVAAAFVAGSFAAAASNVSCASEPNVHQTQEALSNPCIHCHTSAFNAAQTPPHSGSFPDTCEDCHEQDKWSPITKLHDKKPVTKIDCYDCHKKDFEGVDNPLHKGINPTDQCKGCHSTDAYKPLPQDIHATPAFAIVGCYPCHQDNYNGAKNPDHKAGNYPHTCGDCHIVGSPNGWVQKTATTPTGDGGT